MPGAHTEIGSAELVRWREEQDAQIIDVREEIELLNGIIPGAVSLPLSQFLDRLEELEAKPVVFVCASGGRSRDAAAYLVRQGFEHEVANLTGGMHEWRSEGRETAPWRPPERNAEG